MNFQNINKLVSQLLTDFEFYSPVVIDEKIRVSKPENFDSIDWSAQIPDNSFKFIFLPKREELFNLEKGEWKESNEKAKPTIAFGMNVLDLQAHTLFEHVFEKDPYYQKRRRNIFVCGFSTGIESDFRKYRIFHAKYEENVLEHVMFDVFIENKKNGEFLFFTGSEKGQKLLEKYGVKDYEHIEFAGLVPEEGIDKRILNNREAVENSFSHEVWEELSKICLACGKCTTACPTCFCFDEVDQPTINGVKKIRKQSSCFYPEFSKTAGGFKELDSVKKRIYFWYVHKFVRIPEELQYYGCVSCMRCFKVCPVGINIVKNLEKLKVKSPKLKIDGNK